MANNMCVSRDLAKAQGQNKQAVDDEFSVHNLNYSLVTWKKVDIEQIVSRN